MRTLDPSLFDTFLAVAEAGRISAAARTVHRSQPAVTAQIRKLEEAFGTPLFLRSVHGVTLTSAGARLLPYARSVRSLLDEALSNVAAADEALGPLRIVVSTTAAAHLLPSLLARFRSAHPNTALRVRIANTHECIEAVRTNAAPLGLVEGTARAAGVRLEPYVDDEIVPVVGPTASFRVRGIRDLEHAPILWRERGSGTRAVVERGLRSAGARSRELAALDLVLASTEAILGAVTAGLGVGFVSRRSMRAQLSAGTVRLVPGLAIVIRRTFHWALPAGGLSGTASRFHAMARRTPPQ